MDAIVGKYRDMGFDYAEVKGGPTQVKVEARRGDEQVEVIYDRVTGQILKQEYEQVADDVGRSGVEVSIRIVDFLDDDDNDGDHNEDHNMKVYEDDDNGNDYDDEDSGSNDD